MTAAIHPGSAASTSSSTMGETGATWAEQWREAMGPLWQWQLALFGVLLFVAGASLPFADPDLSIHLATGEWIVKHRAVPFVEPFAWTRPGEPFQAYSWAIEALYYVMMASFGPAGLHALQGVVFALLAGVVLVLGRAARWNPWATMVMAAGNVIVALGATPYVRPQAILLIMLPLIWALVYRSLNTDRLPATLVGLLLSSAVVANTHLIFPLTAAPCVLLLTDLPADRKRILLVPLAIAAGWMLSPYALHWHEVFLLNFAPNALFGPPTPISEYMPGFMMLFSGQSSSLVLGLVLAVLPWFVASRLRTTARLLHGVLWLAGLLMFAIAVRSLVVWWLVTIPLCALALEALRSPSERVVRVAQRAIIHGIFVLVAVKALETWLDPAQQAGGIVAPRYLPSTNSRSIEPLARWLDCFTRPEAGGRLVTLFNYGGYIPWRLPHLSESIDGRVIFPDSVSRPESYFLATTRQIPLQPWRTADLAIFPVRFPVATVLDTASGWRRVAISSQIEGPATMIGLWVTDRWWERAGRVPLPRSPVRVMQAREPRKATCAEIALEQR